MTLVLVVLTIIKAPTSMILSDYSFRSNVSINTEQCHLLGSDSDSVIIESVKSSVSVSVSVYESSSSSDTSSE